MIQIPFWEYEKILNHARRDYPRECCGVVLGKKNRKLVYWSEPLANTEEENPEEKFKIKPEEREAIQKKAGELGLDILGFYHSRPDTPAEPSLPDVAEGLPICFDMVVSVEKDKTGPLNIFEFQPETRSFQPVSFKKIPDSF